MTDWPDLAGRLEEGGHVLPVRVYYEDTDFTGIVYHGAYVRFFERARSDFLRLLGIHHKELADGTHGAALAFAVRSMTLDFQRSARIDDILEVHTSLSEHKGARVKLDQLIYRGGELLVSAAVTVAVITAEGRPIRLPQPLAERLLHHVPGETSID
ncbi:tol-pal system-associated acyl-CoA thioesterase [Roseibium salinum]|uniref:Tol-pal system-associated acyl-CoA thioesterase n=1 Tax=Roseibium salinum TaxID=1604349 RepID=A0ABT3R8K4_9HYPH|nr:tol-pal system-associated acyl-CoA thioesterase [Roseibium sp. DSM 29163]MCX2725396.1 tol-pal system-associated acyl-CoA thioesterase [Roseibium sp. DSM 29163]MDN3720778.1 tol-pal system-associated acyl-CoA thioesterase [Roseibium salinum]